VTQLRPILPRRIETTCTVEIENTAERLSSSVVLASEYHAEPGDKVLVHDAPTSAPYGERICVERRATILRAGVLERFWIELVSIFALTELYEVSFTDRRAL
jgi:hypothetical protein